MLRFIELVILPFHGRCLATDVYVTVLRLNTLLHKLVCGIAITYICTQSTLSSLQGLRFAVNLDCILRAVNVRVRLTKYC